MTRSETASSRDVPIDQVLAENNIRTFRTDGDPFSELVASVRSKGVLEPVLLRPLVGKRANGARYELVAGFRRYAAACEAGLSTVPGRVLSGVSDADVTEIRLIENLHREGMNPIDEALSLKELSERAGLSHDAIGKKIGKSGGWVGLRLGLLRLPDAVKEMIRDGRLRPSHAELLVPYADRPEAQLVKLAQLGGRLTRSGMDALLQQAATGARIVRTWPVSENCTCSCSCCNSRGSHQRIV